MMEVHGTYLIFISPDIQGSMALYILFVIPVLKTSVKYNSKGTSNGNASEAKANEGFDNSIFFASEAKRTCSLKGNLLAKRSEHVRKK